MTTDPSTIPRSRAILSAEERDMLAIAMTEQKQQTFGRVSAETGLDAELLRKLVRDGVIEGVAPYRVTDIVGTCDVEQARGIASRLAAARRPVDGRPILASEAMKKYRFGKNSVYKWRDDGWVKVIGVDDTGNQLFNEGDIAFARALADLSGHIAGKAVFPPKRHK